MKPIRWIGLAICAVAICSTHVIPQEPKKAYEKHDTTALYRSLGDVINLGATVYNKNSDYAGCYRIFQGSLLTVRPFLAPDLQKRIDAGLAAAEKASNYADRAWELRVTLDDLRKQLKPVDLVEAKTKEPEVIASNKSPTKPPSTTTSGPASTTSKGGNGTVSGKLMLQGRPIMGTYVITLVGGGNRLAANVKNGVFEFGEPMPTGEYQVAIAPLQGSTSTVVPTRYADAAASGLTITVQSGKQTVELNLVK